MNTNTQRMDIGEATSQTRGDGRQQVVGAQWGGKTAGRLPAANTPSPKSSRRGRPHERRLSGEEQVRRMRTRDLKLHIAMLETQIEGADRGKESFEEPVLQGMRERLKFMREEKTARDLRDLSQGRTIPGLGAFSLGARALIRA